MVTFVSGSNPVFANADHTWVRLDAVFKEIGEEPVSFLAKADDVEPHGIEILSRALQGEFGAVGPYVPRPEDDLAIVKARLCSKINEVVEELLPPLRAQRLGMEAVMSATNEAEALAAFDAIEWPDTRVA